VKGLCVFKLKKTLYKSKFPSFPDDHEVDVIGYSGSTSDDDHSSIRSSTSDGGVTITTWKQLAITEEL
jgi:hypothetical protein